MFRNFNDLKRAIQGDLYTRPRTTSEDDSSSLSTSFKNGVNSKRSSSTTTLELETSTKLNVQAKEFYPLMNDLDTTNSVMSSSINGRQMTFNISSHCNELQYFHTKKSAISQPMDFSIFGENASLIEAAYSDPVAMRAPALIDLAKLIIGKAQENRAWAESLASLSFYFIEQEKHTTFMEALSNSLQYIVRKKCNYGTAGESFYPSFISYLYALYSEVKLKRVDKWKAGDFTASMLLSLIIKVCVDFLCHAKRSGRKEIDSLFFVVTEIGQDLEAEEPNMLEDLMCAVRDAFLSDGASAPVKRMLLEIVELRAAHWQLPARTIRYYQTHLLSA